MAKQIPLTQGKFAIVDDEDYEWLGQWKWYYNQKEKINCGYAARTEYFVKGDGIRASRKILMHRVINKTKGEFQTDHIDGNRLNNQKNNLRDCTQGENQRNRGSVIKSSSRYKGVCYHIIKKKWVAYINNDEGKKVNLGSYNCENEAAKAYDKAAIKYHREFARLNLRGF
jgi:hypothetical protein